MRKLSQKISQLRQKKGEILHFWHLDKLPMKIMVTRVRDRIWISSQISIYSKGTRKKPIFYNGSDDLFLKPPLIPIVKILTALF